MFKFPQLFYKSVRTYDGTSQNLLRGDKALILFPSDCKSGLLKSLDRFQTGGALPILAAVFIYF